MFCILNLLDFWQGGKPTEGQILSSVAQWNFFIFYISYTYWRSICKVLLFCGGSIAFDNCISQGRVWKSDDGHELSSGSPFFLGYGCFFWGSQLSVIYFKEPLLIGTQKVRRRTWIEQQMVVEGGGGRRLLVNNWHRQSQLPQNRSQYQMYFVSWIVELFINGTPGQVFDTD